MEIIHPDLNFAVLISNWAVSRCHFPTQSASAYTSRPVDFSLGSKIIPSSRVGFKYFASQTTASPCDYFGSEQNLAN